MVRQYDCHMQITSALLCQCKYGHSDTAVCLGPNRLRGPFDRITSLLVYLSTIYKCEKRGLTKIASCQ